MELLHTPSPPAAPLDSKAAAAEQQPTLLRSDPPVVVAETSRKPVRHTPFSRIPASAAAYVPAEAVWPAEPMAWGPRNNDGRAPVASTLQQEPDFWIPRAGENVAGGVSGLLNRSQSPADDRLTARLARQRLQRIGVGKAKTVVIPRSKLRTAAKQSGQALNRGGGPSPNPLPTRANAAGPHIAPGQTNVTPAGLCGTLSQPAPTSQPGAGIAHPVAQVATARPPRKSFTLLRDATDDEPTPLLIPTGPASSRFPHMLAPGGVVPVGLTVQAGVHDAGSDVHGDDGTDSCRNEPGAAGGSLQGPTTKETTSPGGAPPESLFCAGFPDPSRSPSPPQSQASSPRPHSSPRRSSNAVPLSTPSPGGTPPDLCGRAGSSTQTNIPLPTSFRAALQGTPAPADACGTEVLLLSEPTPPELRAGRPASSDAPTSLSFPPAHAVMPSTQDACPPGPSRAAAPRGSLRALPLRPDGPGLSHRTNGDLRRGGALATNAWGQSFCPKAVDAGLQQGPSGPCASRGPPHALHPIHKPPGWFPPPPRNRGMGIRVASSGPAHSGVGRPQRMPIHGAALAASCAPTLSQTAFHRGDMVLDLLEVVGHGGILANIEDYPAALLGQPESHAVRKDGVGGCAPADGGLQTLDLCCPEAARPLSIGGLFADTLPSLPAHPLSSPPQGPSLCPSSLVLLDVLVLLALREHQEAEPSPQAPQDLLSLDAVMGRLDQLPLPEVQELGRDDIDLDSKAHGTRILQDCAASPISNPQLLPTPPYLALSWPMSDPDCSLHPVHSASVGLPSVRHPTQPNPTSAGSPSISQGLQLASEELCTPTTSQGTEVSACEGGFETAHEQNAQVQPLPRLHTQAMSCASVVLLGNRPSGVAGSPEGVADMDVSADGPSALPLTVGDFARATALLEGERGGLGDATSQFALPLALRTDPTRVPR
jgi:hypothetical protein